MYTMQHRQSARKIRSAVRASGRSVWEVARVTGHPLGFLSALYFGPGKLHATDFLLIGRHLDVEPSSLV